MDENQRSAPELLAEILKQKRTALENGRQPERVVLSMRNYRTIQRYHAGLGELQGQLPDYITRYRIFELPVYIDEAQDCAVQ